MQFLEERTDRRRRSDELHDQSAQEANGEREVLRARTGPGRCQWGSTDGSRGIDDNSD